VKTISNKAIGVEFFSILVLFLFIIAFCSSGQKELSQIKTKYVIDLDGKKETSIPFSSYFKRPKTIILDPVIFYYEYK